MHAELTGVISMQVVCQRGALGGVCCINEASLKVFV